VLSFATGSLSALIDENTVLIFSEPIANPAMNWYDFEAVRDLSLEFGVLNAIDNTNTVALFDALAWCDIDVTSATKYIGGHGAGLGGIVLCKSFALDHPRYAHLNKPGGDFGGKSPLEFGPLALPSILRGACLRNHGACMSPFNAFLFQLGLDTLDLRMRDISSRCLSLAKYCQSHSAVGTVLHAELGPSAQGIERYFPHGTGGLFSFSLKGGKPAIERFFDALSMIPVATNIGDSKTIIQHVESTSHSQLSQQQLDAAGILPGLLRVSVGLESLDKLIAEFETALAAAMQSVVQTPN
jgi:O-acetylhomoserine (thiol)-lyase